jgi:hypothetical protein
MAHFHTDDEHFCRPHYVATHPWISCINCGKLPQMKRIASGLCWNCNRNLKTVKKAKRAKPKQTQGGRSSSRP